MDIQKELEKYFANETHINCAETTMMAASDAVGLGRGIAEDAGFMSAFAGGTGSAGICGALIGAQSALGRYAVSRLKQGDKLGSNCPELLSQATQLVGLFEAEFGSLLCRDLRPCMAQQHPEGCRFLIRRTCVLLEQLLEQQDAR